MKLGASRHMTLHRTAFHMYEAITLHNVHLGDNNVFKAIEMGSIVVETIVEDNINQIHIKNVLHVSKLHTSLFLVSKFVPNGLIIQFNLNKCIVKSCDGEAIAIAPREQNLYKINFVKVYKAQLANLVQFPMGDGALKF